MMSKARIGRHLVRSRSEPRSKNGVKLLVEVDCSSRCGFVQHIALNQVFEGKKSPLAVHWSGKPEARSHPIVKRGIRYVKVAHRFVALLDMVR